MRMLVKLALSALAALCLSFGAAQAEDNPVQQALEGCSDELQAYCSNVTPGDGRLVFCAKAHEDKLSSRCVYAINRANYWVDYLAHTVAYVAIQCQADALKYCPDVKIGQGRVVNCLAQNRANLNEFCALAIQDIGK